MGDFARHLVREFHREALEGEGAVQTPPCGGPLLQLPEGAKLAEQVRRVRREQLHPGIVRLDRPFEVQPRLHHAPPHLRLQLEVHVLITEVHLQRRPAHAALRLGDGGRELRQDLVLAEEHELARFQGAIPLRHRPNCSEPRSCGDYTSVQMTSGTEEDGATIVAEASDIAQARIWIDALHDEEIDAAFIERGPGGALGGASLFGVSYAVLVPRAHIAEARSVIAELGGGRALVAYRTAEEERQRSRSAFVTVAGGVLLVALAAVVLRFALG